MNSSRNATFAEALGHLSSAGKVFIRLALNRTDAGEKVLRSFVIDVMPQRWLDLGEESLLEPWRKAQKARPPLNNGDVFFFCDWLSGETVLEWFRHPENCGIEGFDHRRDWDDRRESFVLPDMHDNVSALSRPSHAKGLLPSIPYPYTLYTLQPKILLPPQQRDDVEIVGPDGEHFPNFWVAQAEIIYGVTESTLPIQTSNSIFAIRVIDGRGWLKEVRVLPDKVDATVVGTEVIGRAHLALSGSGLRATAPVHDSHVLVDLPPNIPDDVEVVLSSGREVLDIAQFSRAYSRKSPQVIVEREDVFGYVAPTTHQEEQRMAPDISARVVFVVHGRDMTMRNEMFTFLRSIGLQPLEWGQAVAATQTAAPYVGQVLDAAFSKARAVVVLLTPDDEARLRELYWGSNEPDYEKNLTPQARPNVLFEAGMAFGRHPDRTELVELGTLRPFSDVAGRHVVRMDGTTQRRQELAQRLMNAGCAVDLTGIDWHTASRYVSRDGVFRTFGEANRRCRCSG